MSFLPVELRHKMPVFSLADKMPIDVALEPYRQFYGLDFENTFQDLDVQLGKIRVSGFDVVVHSYVPKDSIGSVLVMHGYYDHVGMYGHLIKELLKNKYAVMAYDLPGHGLSSGSRAVIYSFRQYQSVFQQIVQLAYKQLPKPWHVVAQSTGAAIVTEYLLNHYDTSNQMPFHRVVFYAPLVRPVNWPFNRVLHSVVAPFTQFVKRKHSDNSNDSDFMAFRAKDPLQPRFLSTKWVGALKKWIPFIERHTPIPFPVLIIQGQCDQTVDWRHNVPLLQHLFQGSQVVFLPKVKHHVVNELKLYRKDVFSRTVKYLSSTVSH